MKTKKYNIWFWTVPLIFAAVVMAGIRLVSDTPTGYKFWERPLEWNLIEFGFAIIIAYLCQFTMIYLLERNSKHTGRLTFKMFLSEYLMVLTAGIILFNPCLALIHYLINDPLGIDDITIANTVFLLVLIIIYSLFRGNQILNAYIDQKLQTQKIENMQIETELKFLKAQFHPHFLFNALNTIYFQIDEKNETPRKTIEQLSDLLRYQLYDVNQTVTIEQEINFLLTYIDLQKVRMKESLKLDINFNPELKNQKIHSLLLFPLVENALKYVGGEYWIKIDGKLDGNRLLFEVMNAIPPMPVSKSEKGGIGLENLKRRLELLYPGKHKLMISKTADSYKANLMIEF